MNSKGTERINEEGAHEIKVETVDYRSAPGQQEEPKQEKVEVTHQQPHTGDPQPAGGGGVMTAAAGKVAQTIQSAKDNPTFGDKKTN